MDMKLVDAQFETAKVIIDRLETLASCWGVQYEKRSTEKTTEGKSKVRVVNGRRVIHIDDIEPEDFTDLPVRKEQSRE